MAAARTAHIDKPLGLLIGTLLFGGCLVFASAVFGLLARGETHLSSVVFNHLVLGVGAGLVLLAGAAVADYRIWRRYAPHFFVFAIIATALVFVPHVGAEHGGGKRWIIILGQSFQPSELLKIATIVVAAAYFAANRTKVGTTRYGLGGLAGILALPVALLVMQPDLGTLSVICGAVCAMYWAAGAAWRDLAFMLVGVLVAGVLAFTFMPHARARVMTFIDPAAHQEGSSYQIRQSLIAVGSGGFLGRGFGQSVQKFTYLPEPMGDSIFAVASEELGFAGASFIIMLFLAFSLRGLRVAVRVADPFGALLGLGIAVYLGGEAFINIAAMLGVAPLTGIPLTFVSQGGSAMLMSLASAGILLSVSRAAGQGSGKRGT